MKRMLRRIAAKIAARSDVWNAFLTYFGDPYAKMRTNKGIHIFDLDKGELTVDETKAGSYKISLPNELIYEGTNLDKGMSKAYEDLKTYVKPVEKSSVPKVYLMWEEPEQGSAIIMVEGFSMQDMSNFIEWWKEVVDEDWGITIPSISWETFWSSEEEEADQGEVEVMNVRDFAEAIRYPEVAMTGMESPIMIAHGLGSGQGP